METAAQSKGGHPAHWLTLSTFSRKSNHLWSPSPRGVSPWRAAQFFTQLNSASHWLICSDLRQMSEIAGELKLVMPARDIRWSTSDGLNHHGCYGKMCVCLYWCVWLSVDGVCVCQGGGEWWRQQTCGSDERFTAWLDKEPFIKGKYRVSKDTPIIYYHPSPCSIFSLPFSFISLFWHLC